MYVKALKLKSNEEIICDVVIDHNIKIRNPLIISVYYDEGYIIRVEKYLKHLKYDEELEIEKDDIQFMYSPSNEMVLYYQNNIEKVKESDKNIKSLLSSILNEKTNEILEDQTYH